MKINESKVVKLTREDIEGFIKQGLNTLGCYDLESIHFIVEGEEDPADAFAQMPLTYVLKGAICRTKEKEIQK